MTKPNNLMDLLKDQHISLGDVHCIARAIFNDQVTMAGPEGYLVTGVNFDDLPEHVRGFITKGILQFTVENVIDANEPEDRDEADVASFAEDDAAGA